MNSKTGVLLLNIGSPASYQVPDVKKYLLTFLMDKDVINLPFVLRYILVHGLIVPRRAPFSAANYKKVWLEGQGSPLTVYTENFRRHLQSHLGEGYDVKVGMRYAEPTIERALDEFSAAGLSSVLLVPMFPQYAEATTASALKEVARLIKKKGHVFQTKNFPPFFAEPAFIDPSVQLGQKTLAGKSADHVLFSFHGLPESHIRKTAGCLVTPDCCEQQNACAKNCYRAQCFATAKALAEKMRLFSNQWTVSFQSRLGRGEWLKPSTEVTIENLAKSGQKSLAVFCPSFVADCIETLEEIGIGGEEIFHEHGGEDFHLIPCVNDHPEWVGAFAELIRKQTQTRR